MDIRRRDSKEAEEKQEKEEALMTLLETKLTRVMEVAMEFRWLGL